MAAVLRRAVAARNGGAGSGSPSLLRFRSNIAGGGGGQSREAEAIMAEIEEIIEKERASSLLTLMNDLSRSTKLGGSGIRMEADLEERVRLMRDLARRSAKTTDDIEQLRETMDVEMKVLNEKLSSKTEELDSLRWCVLCALRTVAVVSAAAAGAMVLIGCLP